MLLAAEWHGIAHSLAGQHPAHLSSLWTEPVIANKMLHRASTRHGWRTTEIGLLVFFPPILGGCVGLVDGPGVWWEMINRN